MIGTLLTYHFNFPLNAENYLHVNCKIETLQKKDITREFVMGISQRILKFARESVGIRIDDAAKAMLKTRIIAYLKTFSVPSFTRDSYIWVKEPMDVIILNPFIDDRIRQIGAFVFPVDGQNNEIIFTIDLPIDDLAIEEE